MICYFPKNKGRLAFEDGTEKVTVYQHGDHPDFYVYFISNNLPIADLLGFADQGVLFEDYPFKVKMLTSELDNASPIEGYETIKDIPTPHEYSNDKTELLLGAILQTQGKSGRYLNQSELQAFRDAGYTLLGKRDITNLKANDMNWRKEEIL